MSGWKSIRQAYIYHRKIQKNQKVLKFFCISYIVLKFQTCGHCCITTWYLQHMSIWVSKLKINFSGSKSYSSRTSEQVLRFSLLALYHTYHESRHNLIKQIPCVTRTKFPAIKHLAFSLLWKSFRCCRKMFIWCNKTNEFIMSPPVFVSRLLRFTFFGVEGPMRRHMIYKRTENKTNNMFLWCNIQFLCVVVKNLIVTYFVKVCHSYSITNFRLSRKKIFWFLMDLLHVWQQEVSNWAPKQEIYCAKNLRQQTFVICKVLSIEIRHIMLDRYAILTAVVCKIDCRNLNKT